MFADRTDAGARLAELLARMQLDDPVVLGLPRGGVVVAAGAAQVLEAPLDIIVVRKLGAPGNPELGVGAIAEGGVTVLNEPLIARLRITSRQLDRVIESEHAELQRRVDAYRRGRPRTRLAGRTVVIVDDGLATGFTARAAVAAARQQSAARVVLAVPVGAPETINELQYLADDVVAVDAPAMLMAVGASYADFRQTTDGEVMALLDRLGPGEAISPLVEIPAEGVRLPGDLEIPDDALGMVVFAHGSGSSRLSPRNRAVADALRAGGFGTLLFDLLTPAEAADRARVFDIPLLGRRLVAATRWLGSQTDAADLKLGYFGASTGAAAALVAAAELGPEVTAVVSRGGRPDLAGEALPVVEAATLLIVGERDPTVLQLNYEAQARMTAEVRLEIIPDATHLFEEVGALDAVECLAAAWFLEYLV